MNIGTAIKELRKEKGLSQAGLAAAAKTTQAALSQIEGGRRPNSATLKRISAVLGVPEQVFYMVTLSPDDVPEENRHLYNEIFPLIKKMIYSLVTPK